MTNQPKRISLHHGISLSMLIGLFTFTASFFILVSNVATGSFEARFNIQVSSKTDISDKNHSLRIGNEEIYRKYLSSLHDSVFAIDLGSSLLLKKFNPSINVFEFEFDPKKVSTKEKKYYFKKSNYIADKLFYSESNRLLAQRIAANDSILMMSMIQAPKSKNALSKLSNNGKSFFNNHPKILIWVILISIAIAFSFSLIPFLISEIASYRRNFETRNAFLRSTIVAVLIVLLSLLPLLMLARDQFDYLIKPLDTTKLFAIGIEKFGLHWNSIAPYAGVLFWLILLFLMFATAEKILQETRSNQQQQSEEVYQLRLSSFLEIAAKFEKQFIALAIFLAFTIFCTDLMLSELNKILQPDPDLKIFPTEFSFINGLMHTFFLGIIYFFVRGGLNKIKAKILTLAPNTMDLTKIPESNQKKEFVDYLKLILTILAPVLGGGIQGLFELILG